MKKFLLFVGLFLSLFAVKAWATTGTITIQYLDTGFNVNAVNNNGTITQHDWAFSGSGWSTSGGTITALTYNPSTLVCVVSGTNTYTDGTHTNVTVNTTSTFTMNTDLTLNHVEVKVVYNGTTLQDNTTTPTPEGRYYFAND